MPEAYQYSSEPRVITSKRLRRPKANQPLGPHANIMWDRRVVRGSTCTGVKNAEIVKAIQEEAEREAQQEERRVKAEKLRSAKQLELARAIEAAAAAAAAAELAEARLAPDLVELSRAVEPDEPCGYEPLPPPVFVAAVGVSEMATQSEQGFFVHFEQAVAPVVEVLVGKTMQLAFNEVVEEEEQDDRELHANDFDIVRNIELAEKQRLEEARARKEAEKERRGTQAEAQAQALLAEHMHSQAQAVARAALEGLRGDVFNRLAFEDVFQDPVPSEIERLFFPALQHKMQQEADRMALAAQVRDAACQAALDQGLLVHRAEIARGLLVAGWEQRDFLVFDKGFKEITALGLHEEVAAARKQFAELHKTYSERKYKEDLAASTAAIKKYFGRAEKDGAKLLGAPMARLEALVVEAEALGESAALWKTRARLGGIRQKANAAAMAAHAAECSAGGEDAWAAAVAEEAWAGGKAVFPEGGCVRAVVEGEERTLAEHVKVSSEPPSEPSEEDPDAPEEEPPLGPMLLAPEQVTAPAADKEAAFVLAAQLCAQFCPALLEKSLAKYDPGSGIACLSLHSALGVPSAILVDDTLPYEASTPVHAHCSASPHVLWPALLQKALAVVLGGWDQLCAATVSDLMHIVTGAAVCETKMSQHREGPVEGPGLGDVPASAGSAAVWEEVRSKLQDGWLAVGVVGKEAWGLPAGSKLKLLHAVQVPGEIITPPPPEDPPPEDQDPDQEPPPDPEPLPEAQLFCLTLPPDCTCAGSLASPEAAPWAAGLREALGDVLPDGSIEEGTVWLTAPELLNALDSVVCINSLQTTQQPDPEEPPAPEELHALQHAYGQWHHGTAGGAHACFELTSPVAGTVLLSAVSEKPCDFTLTLLPAGHTHKLLPPFGAVPDSTVAASSGRTAALAAQLPGAGEPRVVMVSTRGKGPEGISGGFVLSAASVSGEVTLQQRAQPPGLGMQRYEHRWKGRSAGGPPGGDSWRDNPVWRLQCKEGGTVALALENNGWAHGGQRVGLQVLRNVDGQFKAAVTPEVVVLGEAEPSDGDGALELELEGECLVVPYAGEAGLAMDYRLYVVSDKPTSAELLPPATWQHCTGSWGPGQCGGTEREEPDQMQQWLANPQYRLRLPPKEVEGRVCVQLSQVSIQPKLKPPPPPEEAPEEPEEDPAAAEEPEETAAAEAEETAAAAAEAEEDLEEQKEEPEPEPEYEDEPLHGFVVVQNPEGGPEECVGEGFTELAVLPPTQGPQGSITLDMDLTAGGAIFVLPCLSQTNRTGTFHLSALCAEGPMYMEPTPGTTQAALAPVEEEEQEPGAVE